MRTITRSLVTAAILLGLVAAMAAGPAAACDKEAKADTQASTSTSNGGK